ncbi:hypothetical protein [Methanobrevibacter filiformis]|uniref:Uncharacterized protein n=1 Tax=Methanobrevibacter filiformis TaxID=55758 RepID=A0A166AQI4_9EURY|nr:hypothetical protein [Methanobrevibacter filiformis]KZX12346.1 hypothetical protein MBFIL_11510 [Methanobrevibacter filiformis]
MGKEDDTWISTQMIRKELNLKDFVNNDFLDSFKEHFEADDVKVFKIDIAITKDDKMIDIVSLFHKNPRYEKDNEVVIDSNMKPFFMNKIKKVIDSLKK